MLSHIATDLHKSYIEEVFKPQLGKPGASTPEKSTSPSDLDGDGETDSFEKKVRQFIYDVRHLMRKQNIPVERAFQMRSAKTNYGADVIKTAKEKLGIKSGAVTPVSEESSERMVKVTINYKNGTIDRRNVPYNEISTLRAKPTISSVEVSSNKVSYGAGEKYEKKYGSGGKNTVGDRDGDGTKEPDRHEYAGVKDNAIKKAISNKKKLKGYGVSEGFSNWRQDLKEVMGGVNDEIASRNEKQIKEKKVDNYGGGKNAVIKINPEVTERAILGGNIVESFELDESYVNQVVDIATEFFYNSGLNENGVDIVIDQLGEEKFNEFVFNLAEEYFLSEERSARKRKGGKSYDEIKAEIDKKEAAKAAAKAAKKPEKNVRKEITADKAKKATETAKKEQEPSSEKSSEGKKQGIAGRIMGAIKDRAQKDTELLKKSVDTAKHVAARRGAEAKAVYDAVRERGKKVEQSAGATRARRKATVAAGRAAQAAAPVVKKTINATAAAAGAGAGSLKVGKSPAAAAGRAAGTFVKKMTAKEQFEIQEKAESEQQQKLFGLALSVKRGETPRSEASAEVLKIVDSMSEKKIRDFAKTPHSEVPKKKIDEAISNPEGVTDTKSPLITRIQKKIADKQVENAKNRLGEDIDSLETSDPKIADVNKRIASLEVMYAKKKDPNNKRKILSLNLQKQRLEAQEARKKLKTPNQNNTQNQQSQNPESSNLK
jgi:hypothetical protein